MPKLALNFICKDESHCILSMLNSVKTITDLIVCNDTGSTDGTQEVIKNFGIENNIPTFVFERQFDNFENSRNHAMDKLKEVVKELNWNANDVYGYWCDCDETLIISPNFNKNQFTKDFYMINTNIGQMKYTRNTFFRVSKSFEWYGVVHEFIRPKEQVTSGLAEGLNVDVKMIGNSWKGDIANKYLSHAHLLEKYLANDRTDPRWIFYIAQSFYDSASLKDNQDENEERLRRSIKYYKERVSRTDGYEEERFYSQYRVGSIMATLEYPWKDVQQELLKAYSMDPLRGEPIKVMVDYYFRLGEWNLAYLYSKFMKVNFHNKNPYPTRLLFIDQSLYNWKILETHSAVCFYLGKKDEAKSNYTELLSLINNSPELFSQDDINKIRSNQWFFA